MRVMRQMLFPAILPALSLSLASSVLYAVPAGAPATAVLPAGTPPPAARTAPAVTAPAPDHQVFALTNKFFLRGFESNRHGAMVLGSLRSTRDAALTPYFLQISRSKDAMLQLTGLLDANYVSRNPAILNMHHFFSIPLPTLLTASLAMLIQYGNITNAQLASILKIAPQPSQRLLAAAALVTRKKYSAALPELTLLLASADPSVRFYAAMTILETANAPAITKANAVLDGLATTHSPNMQHIKRSLLARTAVKKISAAIPWVTKIAADKKASTGTRRRAVMALLYLHAPGAGQQLENLIAHANGTIGRIELGLLAIQYGSQIKPASLQVLLKTHSPLQRDIARAAILAAEHKDPTPAILHLIHQGQPLFLNWVYGYCRNPHAPHPLKLLASLVRYSTIVDGQRDVDYLRAVASAKRLANLDSPKARKLLAGFLRSANRGVVEASLSGMMQSKKTDFGILVAPLWPMLKKNHDHRIRQYAAIVMARSGSKTGMSELRKIVLYNDRRTSGFRAMAGWYYLKLAGKSDQLLAAIAHAPPTTKP